MIDIHCHLLPAIDDGATSLEEALALAEIAVNDGIETCILTPHVYPGRWDNNAASITRAVADFRQALAGAGLPLVLHTSGEVRLTDHIFKQLDTGELPFLGSINGYSLLLLEFPHSHIIPGSAQLVEWLLGKCVRPVIAHPERNKAIMRNLSLIDPFTDAGCLLQVTAGSLTGRFGSTAQNIAWQLLEDDRVSFVATDAHNLKARPPVLSEAFAQVASRLGEQQAWRIFRDNQQELIRGRGRAA
jgi:protein-tyrosine phosphatase